MKHGTRFILMGLLGTGLLHAQTTTPGDNAPPGPAANPANPPPLTQQQIGPAFRTACWKGDLAEVQRLLDQGAPLEGRDSLGRTSLFLACHGSPDIVKLLLSRGAKAEVFAFNGDTAFAHACETGDLGSAQLLLAAGVDINKGNNFDHTPLMQAAREGRDQLVALLIAQHVDVNVAGKKETALFMAVWKDHLSIARQLLDAGAHISPLSSEPDPHRPALLVFASWTDDQDMIDLLLAHGADINGSGEDGVSVLGDAIHGSKPETILHLLDKGADPNLLDAHGKTGLMYATNYKFASAILPSFLDHGAKVDTRDSKGRTALMWAAHHDSADAVRFLLDHGADIDATDANGDTALVYAADRGYGDMVQLLKDKGATKTDIHIMAKDKPSPPLSPAQLWAIAVGAIYPQTNGLSPNMLGYGDQELSASELKQDWNITDRNSFLRVIDDHLSSQRRAGLLSKAAQLAAVTDVQFAGALALLTPEQAAGAKGLRAGYIKWKDRVGLAWDLCRMANLVNVGYDMHYISEEEAWSFLQVIARQTQAAFGSWQEMSDNFLDGREGWYGKRDPRYDACAQLLLNPGDPNSPWNQAPWKTDLSSLPNTTPPEAPATSVATPAPSANN